MLANGQMVLTQVLEAVEAVVLLVHMAGTAEHQAAEEPKVVLL
jgi:hypothetical protein